jgi:serine protease Do
MDDTERLPCAVCGEKAALAARMCPHCGASLLVDVTLRAPITDSRVRYKVARALQALPEAPPGPEIQKALMASPPAAVRRVTRAFAHSAVAVLTENGLRGSIERPAGKGNGSGHPAGALVALGLAAALIIAVAAWQLMGRSGSSAAPNSAAVPAAVAKAPSATAATLTPRQLAQRALPATVALRCRESGGSGFFVTEDLVVTNAHVLCPGGEAMEVTLSDDRKFVGQVVRSDKNVDLGLVRVTGAKATALPLGDVADLAAGDKVMIIGSPVGLDFTVQEGSISSLQRSAFGVALLQLDAKISPGNSGGPVIDARGHVVGVVVMKLAGGGVEGIGLALPINYVYSKDLAFVDPPAPAAESEAFGKMVARAQQEVGESGGTAGAARAEETGELGDRPLLVAGHVDQYQRLVVRILRAAHTAPSYEEIAVKIWSGTEAFCTVKGDVSQWKKVDLDKPGSGLDVKSAMALRRIAPAATFFVGESPLRWDLCDRTKMRSAVEIELEGASPLSLRLRVR